MWRHIHGTDGGRYEIEKLGQSYDTLIVMQCISHASFLLDAPFTGCVIPISPGRTIRTHEKYDRAVCMFTTM